MADCILWNVSKLYPSLGSASPNLFLDVNTTVTPPLGCVHLSLTSCAYDEVLPLLALLTCGQNSHPQRTENKRGDLSLEVYRESVH